MLLNFFQSSAGRRIVSDEIRPDDYDQLMAARPVKKQAQVRFVPMSFNFSSCKSTPSIIITPIILYFTMKFQAGWAQPSEATLNGSTWGVKTWNMIDCCVH